MRHLYAGEENCESKEEQLTPFLAAHFLSAFLLFLIEPMCAKRVLPLLGGSAEVWNTCVLFYQSLLLAGYAYAYFIADRSGWSLRKQMICQGVLLLIAGVTVLIGPPAWSPPLGSNPVSWLLLYLFVSVGAPFFVLSTTTPLLQRWLTLAKVKTLRDPYFLFSASNLGSMIALLGYPTLFEPFLTLDGQNVVWSIGYVLLILIALACARSLWSSEPISHEEATPEAPAPSWKQRLHWLVLALVPSSLMLSVTAYLTTNIAPFPLFWIIPLALYLLSLIVVFSRKPILKREWMLFLQPPVIAVLAVLFCWQTVHYSYLFMFPLHLLAFFLTAMVCHGELARTRPNARYLTEFYLLMATGGALGAVFNTLIAPYAFVSVQEYPLGLVLACMLRPRSTLKGWWSHRWVDAVLPLVVLLVLIGQRYMIDHMPAHATFYDEMIVLVPGGVLALLLWPRPIAFALAIGAVLFMAASYWPRNYIYQGRNFFGAIKVERIDDYNLLTHGDILHGAEKMNGSRPREPLTYFHLGSPIGQFFKAYREKLTGANIAIVGLGAGTLASYAQPGQRWMFYEINPQMLQIAMDPSCFTYLSDCQAHVSAIIGDGRLSLAKAPDSHYSVIVFDTFSSDAVPTHMLTREAIQLYLSKLTFDGVLAFHISTRCVDLKPILRALAHDANLICVMELQPGLPKEEYDAHKTDSTWVFLARRMSDLELLKSTPNYHLEQGGPYASVWTDSFSDMIETLHFDR